MVHNKNIAMQWISQLENHLSVREEPFPEFTKTGRKKVKSKIGRIFGGKELRSGLVDVALFQSLSKRQDLVELVNNYGMVIVDEAHHVAASTFENVIKNVNSKYIYGLTATPKREDGLENIIFMRLGEICYTAEKRIPSQIKQNLFLRFTSLGEQIPNVNQQNIHENYNMMVESKDRNQQIVEDILANLKQNRHIIVMTRYVKHLHELEKMLNNLKISEPVYILNSKMKNKQLREELICLKNEGKPFALLTTGSYAGEGFDLPSLDTLLLAMPISGNTSMQQYLGRLLRNLSEKEELRVYDYVDYAIPMIYRMYQKRLRIYKKLGYSLFEDEFTELYRSNLFEGGYETIVNKDLDAAMERIVLVLPYLSKKVLDTLQQLSVSKTCNKYLILPRVEAVNINYSAKYSKDIEALKNLDYQITFRESIYQHFVAIDDKIIWMLPEKVDTNKGEIALRLNSPEMAKKIAFYFLSKNNINLN